MICVHAWRSIYVQVFVCEMGGRVIMLCEGTRVTVNESNYVDNSVSLVLPPLQTVQVVCCVLQIARRVQALSQGPWSVGALVSLMYVGPCCWGCRCVSPLIAWCWCLLLHRPLGWPLRLSCPAGVIGHSVFLCYFWLIAWFSVGVNTVPVLLISTLSGRLKHTHITQSYTPEGSWGARR